MPAGGEKNFHLIQTIFFFSALEKNNYQESRRDLKYYNFSFITRTLK